MLRWTLRTIVIYIFLIYITIRDAMIQYANIKQII